jgi:type IV pilus assembly protein PilQ
LTPAATTGTDGGVSAMTLGTSPASSGRAVNDFQGEEIGLVLRTLARQAKINVVVSDKIVGTVTMRLENIEPMEAIKVVVQSKNLFMDELNGVYYIQTQEEKQSEPTESGNYMFSYAKASNVLALLAGQLQSKAVPPQVDDRTNTIFYREAKSNMDKIKLFLETIDKPTRQVMIESRLVEVNANPKQSYGINWAGVVGGAASPQVFKYGGSNSSDSNVTQTTTTDPTGTTKTTTQTRSNTLKPGANLFGNANNFLFHGAGSQALSTVAGQFAILSAPQMAITLRFLNEDSDAEFLANPRVVTANNQKATIKITRSQPVPTLNFNEQTATAVFSGFQDKDYGNTLIVTPSINKDDFVTMQVQPEISNKVGDATFTFGGAEVSSPIIDKRTLDSNVVIHSGDTLAIGGLLQDEIGKQRTKVPVAGDIPLLGYLFQERVNLRTKRNLLVFVTPTIIKQGYGTGLEDQVSGVHHSDEEFADPNGWRNNAKGSIRVVPTSNRQAAADYPKPGTPVAPVKYKVSAADRAK